MPSVPISEFEHRVAKWAAKLKKSHEPLEITQRGRTSLVVMDKSMFDELQADRMRMQAMEIKLLVEEGEKAIREGRFYTQEQVEEMFKVPDRKKKRRA